MRPGARIVLLSYPYLANPSNYLLFVGRVDEAVEQRDGDCLDRFLTEGLVLERSEGGPDAGRVQRFDLVAGRIEAPPDTAPEVARHQHGRVGRPVIPLVLSKAAADFERVPEALGGEERDLRSLALEHGVRRHRRAVDEEPTSGQQLPGRQPKILGQAVQPV